MTLFPVSVSTGSATFLYHIFIKFNMKLELVMVSYNLDVRIRSVQPTLISH